MGQEYRSGSPTRLSRMSTVSPRTISPSVRSFLPHLINCLHCEPESVFRQVGMDRDMFGVDRRYDLCTTLGRELYRIAAQAMSWTRPLGSGTR